MKKFFAIIAVAFALSFFYRTPFLGRLTGGHWQWINAQPMVFSHNWYRDGAFNSGFVMTYEGSGMESPRADLRTPYVSYTPFFMIPLHVFSLLLQKPIQIQHIQILTILFHLLTALLLGFLSYRLVKDKSPKASMWAFAGASVLWLLHPVPLYYQSLIYFTDLIILPLFALFFVLETYNPKEDRKIRRAQQLLCVLLALIDWYSISIGLVFVLSRMLDTKKWKDKILVAFATGLPFLFGWSLHLLHLAWMGKLEILQQRFLQRSGLSSATWPPLSDLLHKFFIVNIGIVESLLLLTAFLIFFFVKKKNLKSYHLSKKFFLLLFLPPFLHTLLLMEHSYIHAFSTVKFYFPVAVGIAAMGIFCIAEKYNKKWKGSAFLALILMATYCFYVGNTFFSGRAALRSHSKLDVAKWIGNLPHEKDEVVISNLVDISWNPPTQLALSGSHVWTFSSYEKLVAWNKVLVPSAHSLLWIEKWSKDREICRESFRKAGVSIQSEGDLEAIRFANMDTFLNLPEVKSGRCLCEVPK